MVKLSQQARAVPLFWLLDWWFDDSLSGYKIAMVNLSQHQARAV